MLKFNLKGKMYLPFPKINFRHRYKSDFMKTWYIKRDEGVNKQLNMD